VPSPFLTEIRDACDAGAGEVGVWAAEPEAGATNPLDDDIQDLRWPYDPLGSRRAVVEEGAALVRAAQAGDDVDDLLDEAEVVAAAGEWELEVEQLIAERERSNADRPVEVPLPDQLSASQLMLLRDDPDALARAIRRPVPQAPRPLARRGTLFHSWLESRWGSPRLLDVDDMPGSADEGAVHDRELATLQTAFLASAWADRVPLEIEAPFELLVARVLVRGRVDAVFGAPDRAIEVVDWKTGHPPRGPADESVRAIQLAVYRLAFARLYGLPVDAVGAAFHHVRENLTIRPVDLLDEGQLEEMISSLPAAT
jgi:DNA helicase-2/ATP-dependent DNA helicase PcrA